MLYLPKMPTFIKKVFSEALCNGPRDEKVLYLTFDDGPTPKVTSWVMDLLDKYAAKATFFWLGKHLEKYPEFLPEAKIAGHVIGNHTFNHPSGWKTSLHDYLANIERCENIHPTPYFRPPYGKLTWKQYQQVKKTKKIVLWDVVSYDFDQKISREKCLSFTMKNISNGSIIVFHDSHKAWSNLQYVLPRVLEKFTDQGYQFKNILNLNRN